jgi:hypothetical protein
LRIGFPVAEKREHFKLSLFSIGFFRANGFVVMSEMIASRHFGSDECFKTLFGNVPCWYRNPITEIRIFARVFRDKPKHFIEHPADQVAPLKFEQVQCVDGIVRADHKFVGSFSVFLSSGIRQQVFSLMFSHDIFSYGLLIVCW